MRRLATAASFAAGVFPTTSAIQPAILPVPTKPQRSGRGSARMSRVVIRVTPLMADAGGSVSSDPCQYHRKMAAGHIRRVVELHHEQIPVCGRHALQQSVFLVECLAGEVHLRGEFVIAPPRDPEVNMRR